MSHRRLAVALSSLFFVPLAACKSEPAPAPPTPEVTAATTTTPTSAAADAAAATPDAAAATTPDAAVAATPDAGTTAPAADGWVELAPKGEGFKVAMPGQPDRELKPVEGAGGHKTQLVQYTYAVDDIALAVSASPIVQQLVDEGNKDMALDKTLATQIDVPGRTLRYKKPLTVGDALGREAEIDMTLEGQSARMRIVLFIQGAYMFQALAVWAQATPDAEAPATVARFFKSHELTGDVSGLGAPVDLWLEFKVPELGLATLLPKQPTTESSEEEIFVGKSKIVTSVSLTSFPMSAYTIESATIGEAHAKKTDDALLGMWKTWKKDASQGGAGGPKVGAEGEGELLGKKGLEVALAAVEPDSKVERPGIARVVVERDAAGVATRYVVATVFAAEAADLPELAKRFFGGIKAAP